MRIWSIHPKYLDPKGLVALWRETLLAQKVLAGKTKGYLHHPQLHRFKQTPTPLIHIGWYLHHVAEEAGKRGYCFDTSKILEPARVSCTLVVTRGQLRYETKHLLEKLAQRSPDLYDKWSKKREFEAHPIFRVVNGIVEDWEISAH